MWEIPQLEERRRLMSIRLYGLDDRWTDLVSAELDQISELTRDALGVDGAGVNLMVDDRQVTVGTAGGEPVPPVSREASICSAVLSTHSGPELVEIPDLLDVPELHDNPFVDGSIARLRFYAAAPLVGKHALALGTLCVWSTQPRAAPGGVRRVEAVVNVLDERRRALVPDDAGLLRPAQ